MSLPTRPARLVSLVLASVLAAFLVGAPAQAAPRSPDPEVVDHAARASTSVPARAIPATVDSDVYVYAVSPTFRTYFVVAGHLTLSLRTGSTTAWSGSLVDYVGNKAYKASADATDPSAPVLKLESRNGRFTFTTDQFFGSGFYSGHATSKPSGLKVALGQIYFSGSPHSVTSATYAINLVERSGAPNDPIEYTGTLTVAYDANSRISGGQVTVTNGKGKNVTHALKSSGFYSTAYLYTVAQVDKRYFGLAATVSGGSMSGNAFAADGSKTTQWALSGTA